MSLSIQKGRVLVYRVFDVGDEIDLDKAIDLLKQNSSPLRFRLQRDSRAMIINNAPVSVTLGNCNHRIGDTSLSIDVVGKIWHFGVISISLAIAIPTGTTWPELISIASSVENDLGLHQLAQQKCRELAQQISVVIQNPGEAGIFEDYVIHFLESVEGIDKNAMGVFQIADVHSLILSENREVLSEQAKKAINESCFQYSVNDLAVIDWNSALVIEPSGSMDVPDVIEFALCQLLEMRYYDDVLDDKLAELYDSVGKMKYGLLSDVYSTHATSAGQKYIEISEVVERVENSMKVVGDFYLANIFRAASGRLRFRDWQVSVDQKLNNLAEFSKLLHGQVNERRAVLLEVTIILLIAIELIPIFREFLTH